jgi:hypothetical protein
MAAIMFEFDVVEMFANSIMAAFSLEHTVSSSKFWAWCLSRGSREQSREAFFLFAFQQPNVSQLVVGWFAVLPSQVNTIRGRYKHGVQREYI